MGKPLRIVTYLGTYHLRNDYVGNEEKCSACVARMNYANEPLAETQPALILARKRQRRLEEEAEEASREEQKFPRGEEPPYQRIAESERWRDGGFLGKPAGPA